MNLRFDAEQIALLERLSKKHRGKKAAVLAGLRALEAGAGGGEPTKAELLAMLARRLK